MLFLHIRLLMRAAAKSARLPPGHLDPGDREMHTDRLYGLKRAQRLGPIFKTIWSGNYTTCVVGHDHARRLLASNEDSFPDATTDLTGLFPVGALRAMTGETHQKYRRLLIQALQATPFAAHEGAIRTWILDRLTALAKARAGSSTGSEALRASLREITTGIMIRLIYGIAPGTPDYLEFVRDYRQLGPDFPVKKIEPLHSEAFERIKARVQGLIETIRRGPADSLAPSYLKYLVGSGGLDETALGNFIWLFEPAHFDLYSLWRWILRFLASHPEAMARVQAETGERCRKLCEAIALETLRLEQSEVLYRTPVRDVVFEGYLIPKGTIMRACLWEGHKNKDVFPDPFKFDPDRFLGRKYKIEEYAPFGLDKTRCVGADLVVDVSAMFIEILLKNFTIALIADGPPVFGTYHWQPSPDFSISIATKE